MVDIPTPELDTVWPFEMSSASLLNRKNFFIAVNCYKYSKKEKAPEGALSVECVRLTILKF